MTIVPVMWSVWVALVAVLAALFVYRARLTRDEEDQLFLDDSFNHEKVAQAEIVARVNKVEPLVRVSAWLVAAATAWVIVYYIIDIINHLR